MIRYPIFIFNLLILLLSVCIVPTDFSFASVLDEKDAHMTAIATDELKNSVGDRIEKITFQGLKRTGDHVIKRELLFSENSPIELESFVESIQRLKNLSLFSSVNYELKKMPSGKKEVIIEFEEKWTLIPIFSFGGGGGVTYFVTGAYDINTFGNYQELGIQYENLSGASSIVTWFRDPRFLGKRLTFGFDVWSATRNRSLYDSDGEVEGGYTMNRKRLNTFLSKEIHKKLRIGVGLLFENDEFDQSKLGTIQKDRQATKNPQSPQSDETFIGKVFATLGRINLENYLEQGQSLNATFSQAVKAFGSDLDFNSFIVEGKYLQILRDKKDNFGARFTLGHTDARTLQHYYFLGGLRGVRGFPDSRFRGRKFWQANLEYRIPGIKFYWEGEQLALLQHNFFFDSGAAKDKFDDLSKFDSQTAYSVGTGVRFILPKVHRFIGRLDFAYSLQPEREFGISFGAQQFF